MRLLPWPILLYWHHPSNSITLRIISTVTHQDEQDWILVSSMRKSQCQRLYPLCHRCFHKNWTLSFQREVSASFCYSHLIVHNVSSHTQPSLTDPGSPPLLRCSSVMMTGQSGAVLERIVKFDRIPNTEYIRILKIHRIPNTEYIQFLKNERIRIPNSAIRT